MKDINKIPIGIYCYDKNSICPYWSIDNTKPHQENGYCSYLQKGDWDINNEGGIIIDVKTGQKFKLDYYPFGGLLWDQVKECGIKDYEEWCLDCKYMRDFDRYKLTANCIKHNKIINVEKDYCKDFEPDDSENKII